MTATSDNASSPPSYEEVLFITCVVVSLAGNGPQKAYIALAQMIRNRRHEALAHIQSNSTAHPVFGDGSWRSCCPRASATMSPDVLSPDVMSRAHFRAMASICRVIADEEEDLVQGATRCHLHDETPDWSLAMKGTALIGSHIFCKDAAGPGEGESI